MSKYIIYPKGNTLYGKPEPDSTPWGGDVTNLTELDGGLYEGDTDKPYVFVQAGGSPADSDEQVGVLGDLFYGTISEGDQFHLSRLHSWDWNHAATLDKVRALYLAGSLIDQFRYIKAKVGDDQNLEFPRTDQTEVPKPVRHAAYLIADALIGGRDPDADFEALRTKVETYGPVRTEYERGKGTQEHLSNLIPSPRAWNLIKPYLKISNTFDFNKG